MVRGQRLDFRGLVAAIQAIHERCAAEAGRTVNIAVTVRNWTIGFYIREFEQRGKDRDGRQVESGADHEHGFLVEACFRAGFSP